MNGISEAKIRRDACHAIRVGRTYLIACERFGIDLRTVRVMELGAGWNLGASLMLGCHGAHVVAAEPGMVSWQESYHRPLYECMLRLLAADFAWEQLEIFRRVLEPGGYPADRVTMLRTVGEKLDAIPDASIDFIGSNAVLEHVSGVPLCIRELHRITKPGGFGAHQIDLRDHRDFSRPVDYLLQSDAEFRDHYTAADGNSNKNGNRLRQAGFEAAFAAAGFHVDGVEQNMFSETRYRAEIAAALRTVGTQFTDEDIRVISARFYVQKPVTAGDTEWCRMGPSGERYGANKAPDSENVARADAFIKGVRKRIATLDRREDFKNRLKKVPGLHAVVRALKRPIR